MKVEVTALNKKYLVEFKSDDQFISFLTQHNDKINNIEILLQFNFLAASIKAAFFIFEHNEH